MARPVKITVNNNTGMVLKLKTQNVVHGKFTSNPPAIIEASGSWACSTRTGGAYGPEGTITYETDGGDVTVEFYYNHPIGSGSSSYRVVPNPSDSMGYEIKGSFKGHDQNITFELYTIS
nr:hypothetical protein [Pedobacter sp. ASV19]